MKKYFPLCLSVAVLLFCQSVLAQSSIMGFTGSNAARQRSVEKEFDTALHTHHMDKWMKRLSARPHHVGSPYDKKNVLFIDSLFRGWGYDTRIDTYYVLFPTPKVRQLELIAPTRYKAVLMEKVIPGDPYTAQTKEQLPPYNAYSADGDITGELVFVNYGVPADYKKLAEMGVSVKGKIVIAKYGGSWRGIKPKVAYQHGAIGCILYSDPEGDGYYQGDTYPKGAYKNPYAVQRGSVADIPVYPGDPLTPGYAATKDAKRMKISDARTIMKIPVLPISYHDAQPLLAALEGPVAPAGWRGALPITYHIGPGPAKVHLKVAFNWDIKPIYDVTAMMTGSEYPNEWVLRGNHQDAWVNGAADPVSGLVAELSEARSMSRLAGHGWRPRRSIVFCVWDGEEPGLLGSTEWVEDHENELKQKAVAYINSDNNGRGLLYAGGSHSLEKFFSEVAFSVTDPEKGISVGQRSLDAGSLHDKRKQADDFLLSALGSGSDYSPFLQHLGIAAMNLGFGGEDGGGEYHTMYDDYILFKKFKDPGFKYEVALAEVAGKTVLRLADADILPFDFTHFYKTVDSYAGQVQQLADDMRRETVFQNKLIADSIYERAGDPEKTFVVPQAEQAVPYFDFAPLQNALAALHQSADDYARVFDSLEQHPDEKAIHTLNAMVFKSERYLTSDQGLPGRPWYKHLIYAPGLYTGYGVKTLPGIREAIEQRQFKEVDPEIQLTSKVLTALSRYIDKMSEIDSYPDFLRGY
jgi:N-acetylated-alpha-linked acidic dipeptidase